MTTDYETKVRSDNTVRITTPKGHHIWLTRDMERNKILVHTSIRLAGHMHFVDDLNELPYVTVTRVMNHDRNEAAGALSTVTLTPLSDNALAMLVDDLAEIYESEFHEQLLMDQAG